MIETELCTFTLEACQIAADMGITRVELCASPYEGGTTPSAAFIRMARRIPHLKLSGDKPCHGNDDQDCLNLYF